MTGPTHLWSGDWESESARTADDLANAPAPVFDPEPEPEPEPRAARRWSRRQMAVALTTGVAAAAIAVVLVSAFTDGSNGPKAHKLAAAPTVHAQRPTGGAAPTTPAACKQTPAACAQVTPAVVGADRRLDGDADRLKPRRGRDQHGTCGQRRRPGGF